MLSSIVVNNTVIEPIPKSIKLEKHSILICISMCLKDVMELENIRRGFVANISSVLLL